MTDNALTLLPGAVQGQLTTVGWVPPRRRLAFEDYEALLENEMLHQKASPFILGDILNYGERVYGEKYAQAVDVWMLRYGTLANYAYVCDRIEISRRRENLSFSHHQETAPLENLEQDALLSLAEKHGWNSKTMRVKVREWRDKRIQIIDGEIVRKDETESPPPEPPAPEPAAVTAIVAEAVEALIEKEEFEPLPDDGPQVVTVDLSTGEIRPAPQFSRNGYEPQRWARAWRQAAYKYRNYYQAWRARAERLEDELAQLKEKE